jgi:hypothetical protein
MAANAEESVAAPIVDLVANGNGVLKLFRASASAPLAARLQMDGSSPVLYADIKTRPSDRGLVFLLERPLWQDAPPFSVLRVEAGASVALCLEAFMHLCTGSSAGSNAPSHVSNLGGDSDDDGAGASVDIANVLHDAEARLCERLSELVRSEVSTQLATLRGAHPSAVRMVAQTLLSAGEALLVRASNFSKPLRVALEQLAR